MGLSSLIVGLVVGLLAHLAVGRRRSSPLWLSLIVGVVAAYLGTWIGVAIGLPHNTASIDYLMLLVQIVVAAVLVAAAARLFPARGVVGTAPADPNCRVCRGSGMVVDGKYSLPQKPCRCTATASR
jgi:uncharacterized membrane protein YeaQ/YmgE (transglycosylase-associated protein family)